MSLYPRQTLGDSPKSLGSKNIPSPATISLVFAYGLLHYLLTAFPIESSDPQDPFRVCVRVDRHGLAMNLEFVWFGTSFTIL